ncbi:MAG: hypothetical protein LC664_06095 [Flavobacteriales bacterium]|nr:hypothetical protein [Flavobacteriales bacterium]
MSQSKVQHAEIKEKQHKLDVAKQVLKDEFVGVDRVIDDVVDAIGSWYLFPEIQEKPLIINLWGLTGVGKTSLVQRLASLVDFEKQFYPFDLGDLVNRRNDIKFSMERIFENEGGYPVILAFDEFQHARTLDKYGKELEYMNNQIIWKLMDSGRFYSHYGLGKIDELYELIGKLNQYLRLGVEVERGTVIKGITTYRKMREKEDGVPLNAYEWEEDEELRFLPKFYWKIIYEATKNMFSSRGDVKLQFDELDGPGTIKLLRKVIKEAQAPREIDCSKCLIFVMGNLDEAYHMSGNQNADISADDFHIESLRINVPDIKEALKARFRHEQIARLGNHHIIYPALSRQHFEEIIHRELNKIANKARSHFDLEIHFHASLKERLYLEGVYPTHGTRPLFTTIYQMVHSRLGKVVHEIHKHKLTDCSVRFEGHARGILVRFLRGEKPCHRLLFEQVFELNKLREDKRDDQQAITAVHESGHAILAVMLLHTLPKLVCSVTSDTTSNGFSRIEKSWEYTSKREILSRIALLLGGLIAEKIVFGEDYITDGSAFDIKRATHLATSSVKEDGLGSVNGYFDMGLQASSFAFFDNDYRLNSEARDLLSTAARLAEETLKEQEKLLLHMANHLSDHSQLKEADLAELVKAHAVNFDMASLIVNGGHIYYREQLKKKVEKHAKTKKVQAALTRGVRLNGEG